MKPLSNAQHDAVMNSPVGQFLNRLIREEVNRGGDTHIPGGGGSVIQMLWREFNRPDLSEQEASL